MSHSKRNTSLAFFTSYERDLLRSTWGTQTANLTRESFLEFGSCLLCLKTANDPVSCCGGPAPQTNPLTSLTDTAPVRTGAKRKRLDDEESTEHGIRCHIYCRECAVKDLIAQGERIKELEKKMELDRKESAQAEAQEANAARQRAIEEFERVQSGLGKVEAKRSREQYWKDNGVSVVDSMLDKKSGSTVSTKPTSNSSVPVPAATEKVEPPKLKPICPYSIAGQSHPFGLKYLVAVNFTLDETVKGKDKRIICPACSRDLNNSSKAVMAHPCGHVVCGSCTDRFVLNEANRDGGDSIIDPKAQSQIRCYVCDEDLSANTKKKKKKKKKLDKDGKSKKSSAIKPGLVQVHSDGTGFAAGGQRIVRAKGLSFQHG